MESDDKTIIKKNIYNDNVINGMCQFMYGKMSI
jgi:hypothetical protein